MKLYLGPEGGATIMNKLKSDNLMPVPLQETYLQALPVLNPQEACRSTRCCIKIPSANPI